VGFPFEVRWERITRTGKGPIGTGEKKDDKVERSWGLKSIRVKETLESEKSGRDENRRIQSVSTHTPHRKRNLSEDCTRLHIRRDDAINTNPLRREGSTVKILNHHHTEKCKRRPQSGSVISNATLPYPRPHRLRRTWNPGAMGQARLDQRHVLDLYLLRHLARRPRL
jgi:hypothetical protein